jgi:hypothetical protein
MGQGLVKKKAWRPRPWHENACRWIQRLVCPSSKEGGQYKAKARGKAAGHRWQNTNLLATHNKACTF